MLVKSTVTELLLIPLSIPPGDFWTFSPASVLTCSIASHVRQACVCVCDWDLFFFPPFFNRYNRLAREWTQKYAMWRLDGHFLSHRSLSILVSLKKKKSTWVILQNTLYWEHWPSAMTSKNSWTSISEGTFSLHKTKTPPRSGYSLCESPPPTFRRRWALWIFSMIFCILFKIGIALYSYSYPRRGKLRKRVSQSIKSIFSRYFYCIVQTQLYLIFFFLFSLKFVLKWSISVYAFCNLWVQGNGFLRWTGIPLFIFTFESRITSGHHDLCLQVCSPVDLIPSLWGLI